MEKVDIDGLVFCWAKKRKNFYKESFFFSNDNLEIRLFAPVIFGWSNLALDKIN